ncbi:hypothetical protein P170DRAFT_476043 [Aspergillus steynii IBT 23096]|uniref:Uncharacterized protein n=1 Tax=Aspergillus steynii IBT 23096 TaxID=1392250 RepID=A0A2I2GA57_9EURO|nr:uncharacterized protein P170DRAFT_476043 [Aspergillus steynii IBT 23096]PLB49756.1 hypothetical protein P170DRAFT_476043 [Aspergillus steynii IBT 23096]
MPKHILMECPLHTTSRRKLIKHLGKIKGLRGRVQDYNAVLGNPQTLEDEEKEENLEHNTLLAGLELDDKDNGYTES